MSPNSKISYMEANTKKKKKRRNKHFSTHMWMNTFLCAQAYVVAPDKGEKNTKEGGVELCMLLFFCSFLFLWFNNLIRI